MSSNTQVQKLFYTKYFSPQTLQVIATSKFLNIKLQLNEYNKKYDAISLVTKKGVLNRPNSILRYLSASNNLSGSTVQQKNDLNVWFQHFNTDILPVLTQIYGQIFGEKQTNQVKFNYCLTQIHKTLKILDQSLKIKTFFVANNITIVDICFICYFQTLFKLIVTQSDRKKYVNLFRWFNYLREIPVFTQIYGKKYLCGKDAFKIDFQTKLEQKQQAKVEKLEVKKVETNKVETQSKNKKKAENVPKVKTAKQQVAPQNEQKSEEKAAPQKTGTVQLVSLFNLDDFKREFQNSQNKQTVIKNLLDTFDKENWSLWKVHYLKDVTEGKVLFLTQNLANGCVQRLQNLRKTGFGSWGVYGEQGDYEIRGVQMWKGLEVAQAWKEHPSHQYHQFTKLDPNNPNDRQIVFEYWMDVEVAQGLMNRGSRKIL